MSRTRNDQRAREARQQRAAIRPLPISVEEQRFYAQDLRFPRLVRSEAFEAVAYHHAGLSWMCKLGAGHLCGATD